MSSKAETIVPRLLDLDGEARRRRGRVSFVRLAAAGESRVSRVDPGLVSGMSFGECFLSEAAAHPVHRLGYYWLADARVTGEGYAWIDGRLACTRATMPRYWQEMVSQAGLRDPAGLTERVLAAPAVLVHSRDYNRYGHFWLDIAPRLFLLKRERPRLFSRLRFIMPGDLAPWASDALAALYGIEADRIVSFDPCRDSLRCERLLVPTLVHADYHFHPLANAFYDHVVGLCGEAPRERSARFLYVTRRAHAKDAGPATRQLGNAADAERLAEAMGLVVVAPERLPWRAQVALFAQAQIIVGEHGSAMKNLLFAPAGSAAVSMAYLNTTQSAIAALRGQALVTLLAEGKKAALPATDYRIDLGRLREAIEAAMRWHDGRRSANSRSSGPSVSKGYAS